MCWVLINALFDCYVYIRDKMSRSTSQQRHTIKDDDDVETAGCDKKS